MQADIVFINGEVITVDQKNKVVEAVAVKGNRISAVGSNREVKDFIGEETKVIDLQGKTLLPGFIDAHIHLILYGVNQLAVSCKDEHIKSIEDLLNDLKEKASTIPKGEWIRAWGFNETVVKEKRYPTIAELDAISVEHPIIVSRTCSHISVVNSKALEIAKINENSENPTGGIIEKDKTGRFTGRLIETANMIMTEIASYTESELMKAVKIASEHFVAAGITSIHEAGAYGPESFRLLQHAVKSKDIRVRIYAMIGSLNNSHEFVNKMVEAGVVTGTGDERFKIGPAKMFTDGSSTGPTIATRETYSSDPDNFGILYYSEEEIYQVLGQAHKKGYQITVHAQGDRAIEMYLNCVEKALEDSPRKDHRHRIEHAGISSPDLQERMKNLELIPIPNPPFPYEFGDIYIQHYGNRVNHMYAVRDFIDNGIIAAGGSDAPVTDYNPLLGIHVAVNRRSQSGSEIGVAQSISVMEAIKLYTWNGAYASFEEDIKGSIEVGKLADFVVLTDSILKVNPLHIKDLQVESTIIDGEILYHRESLVEI
ncbi:amidohydrolase [Peribacillus butanolivorans]|uniref:Amidohydrolase n=1 Tax=Peribacillus butanolivorans TaxID=421767 RepID=A0AAX0RVH1_9BACI|nr:amidohydrolase [Peribacillus butanolivorans]PEJ27325.1 amidohydrolase [Peribacillus butanolivorans]QNU04691.1 amidohydrolase [Peribacillus butanolivorans]